jgi:signal transduction histidine kinase
VKHIVQGHGGAPHIASAVGEGTTVTAYLPIVGAAGQT